VTSNAKWLAEFIGTFALVFFGCGAAAMDAQFGGLGGVGVALVFGLVIMAMIYAVGHISGAHFNPAVTVGFLCTKKMDAKDGIPFVLAQCAAACLAAWCLKIGFGSSLSAAATQVHIPIAQAFALEVIITFFLMFVISAVATDSRAAKNLSGVAIGGTVALASMFAGPLTGASMNPARSLGPALLSGELQSLWLYFAAPVLGAVLGAKSYQFMRGKPA
jgi:aquaporin NIP